MPEFKPITSQEELDSIILKRLEREGKRVTKELTEKYKTELDTAKKYKEEKQGLLGDIAKLQQELQEKTKEAGFYAKTKEDLEKSQSTVADLTKKVRAYETQHIKTEAALKYGLDLKAVDFIKGETAEEIQASAEQLKTLVNTNTLPLRESTPADSTEEALKGFASKFFNNKGE